MTEFVTGQGAEAETPEERHIYQLLTNALNEHERRKAQLGKADWTLHIGVLGLGAVSTILLGLQIGGSYETWSRNLVLVISATVTFLSALLTFWNLDSYWLKRKVISTELRALQVEYGYVLATRARPIEQQQLDAFFARYQQIVSQHTEYWVSMMTNATTIQHEQRKLQQN